MSDYSSARRVSGRISPGGAAVWLLAALLVAGGGAAGGEAASNAALAAQVFHINARGVIGRQKVGLNREAAAIGTVSFNLNKTGTTVTSASLALQPGGLVISLAINDKVNDYLLTRPRDPGKTLMAFWGDLREDYVKNKDNTFTLRPVLTAKGFMEVFRGVLEVELDRRGKPGKVLLKEGGNADNPGRVTCEINLEGRGDNLLEAAGSGRGVQIIGSFDGDRERRRLNELNNIARRDEKERRQRNSHNARLGGAARQAAETDSTREPKILPLVNVSSFEVKPLE